MARQEREPQQNEPQAEELDVEKLDVETLKTEIKRRQDIIDRGAEFSREFGVNLSDNNYLQDAYLERDKFQAELDKKGDKSEK